MTFFVRLLAKRVSNPHEPPVEATLQGHTALVLSSAERVLASSALPSLAAIGRSPVDEERLRRLVLLGAFLHDLGKCNSHFQEMVRGQAPMPSGVEQWCQDRVSPSPTVRYHRSDACGRRAHVSHAK